MKTSKLNATASGLIKTHKTNSIVSHLLLNNNLGVLDIGCQLPVELFILYHDLNFKTLKGIDKNPEEKVIEEALRIRKIEGMNPQNIYDLYLSDKVFYFDVDDIAAGKTRLSKEDFYKTFQVVYNTYAEEYLLTEPNNTYDLVIVSNLLHLIPDINRRNYILNKSKLILKENGLLFLKVNHEDNPVAKEKKHIKFNEQTFMEMFADCEEIASYVEVDKKENLKVAMSYLGYKK